MDTTRQANEEQIALWNDSAGRAWVELQETLDRVLEPFQDLLVEAVAARKRRRARVIDTVRAAFDPYVHGDEARFTAGCWMIGARAQ